jgi:adenosylhomocysteine nucleosidase
MPKVAMVAALEREVYGLTRGWSRAEQQYDGRTFVFFERDDMVVVCGGIGVEAARRAAEAVIALYRPMLIQSVGFAGALDGGLRVGDLFMPAVVIDARDGSRVEIDGGAGQGQGLLVTFIAVAGTQQKANLAQAYGAQAVDMEAAAVAAAARTHGIRFNATKVISDEVSFEMPGMDRFIDAQGHFRTANFVAFIALRPRLWRRVVMLARNSHRATKVLGEHLGRCRQELSRASERGSGKMPSPPPAGQPASQAAARSRLNAGGRE